MSISQNLIDIKSQLPQTVELIAVSKTNPESAIQEAYDAGQRHFGENKVQELIGKYENLPKDIYWHLLGHLQTNKVKYIAPFVHLIHSVDSEKLLIVLQKEAEKNNRSINCLLQAKIAKEDTKFGMTFVEIEEILAKRYEFPNLNLIGIMAMATNTNDEDEVRAEFSAVSAFLNKVKDSTFKELSIGMSDDWHIAVEEGSTMVRIGSSIFGRRNYL